MGPMIAVKLKCKDCGKSLMNEKKKIDNEPSVEIIIEYGGKRGRLNLSSLYGSYNIETDVDVPMDETVQFFCPHCDSSLQSTRLCELCDAPMVAFNFVHGGAIQICSRRGCKKHLLEFEDLDTEIRMFNQTYSNYL